MRYISNILSIFRVASMEVPKLVLGDHELAARVTELLKPLVITPEKKTRMIRVLEEELDLGHQFGLDGKYADHLKFYIDVAL